MWMRVELGQMDQAKEGPHGWLSKHWNRGWSGKPGVKEVHGFKRAARSGGGEKGPHGGGHRGDMEGLGGGGAWWDKRRLATHFQRWVILAQSLSSSVGGGWGFGGFCCGAGSPCCQGGGGVMGGIELDLGEDFEARA